MATVVWEADPETFQFRYVSPSAEELLGYPVGDWLEPGFWVDRLHPEDRERAVADCVAATRNGEDHRLEYRLVAADGSAVWVEDDVECADGALRGVIVDTTARRHEEETSQFLLENSSDVITILDADRIVQYKSPGVTPILGYDPSELVGTDALDWIHPDDRARVADAVHEALRTDGFMPPLQARLRHRDGSWRWLEGVARTIGERIIVTARDVTLQRRAAEAQKLEALGCLANAVAHDFNNILFVVKGHAELLREKVPEAAHDHLSELIDAADRGAALTRQLLSFSRRHLTQEASCDPVHTVRELGAMLAPVLGEKIVLAVQAEPGTPEVAIGRGPLEQVVLNLILNARDALPDGGRIGVDVETVEGRVRIRVADTGTGMDETTRSRMFEPFYTTKLEGSGTGLGLATVLNIVAQHGGDIEVATELGAGSTFDVHLPPAPATQPTVLVVEEDELVRRVVGEALGDAGYRVLYELGDEHVDVALLDAAAPHRELRGRGVRIVVMTDLPDLGAYDYADGLLVKPFSLDALRATVARVVSAR